MMRERSDRARLDTHGTTRRAAGLRRAAAPWVDMHKSTSTRNRSGFRAVLVLLVAGSGGCFGDVVDEPPPCPQFGSGWEVTYAEVEGGTCGPQESTEAELPPSWSTCDVAEGGPRDGSTWDAEVECRLRTRIACELDEGAGVYSVRGVLDWSEERQAFTGTWTVTVLDAAGDPSCSSEYRVELAEGAS